MKSYLSYLLAAALLCLAAAAARAEQVGSFSNDWTGNGMVVEAFADPQIAGVTCHVVHFDRSVLDRLPKGASAKRGLATGSLYTAHPNWTIAKAWPPRHQFPCNRENNRELARR